MRNEAPWPVLLIMAGGFAYAAREMWRFSHKDDPSWSLLGALLALVAMSLSLRAVRGFIAARIASWRRRRTRKVARRAHDKSRLATARDLRRAGMI